MTQGGVDERHHESALASTIGFSLGERSATRYFAAVISLNPINETGYVTTIYSGSEGHLDVEIPNVA